MRAHPFAPAHHAAPILPPSRRTWLVVGLLVALTVLPTLVVVLAGRSAVRGTSTASAPYQPDRGGVPVIVEPGAGGPRPPRAGAPVVPAPMPERTGGVGGPREESGGAPCPEPGVDSTPNSGGGGGNPAPPADADPSPDPAPSSQAPQPSEPPASPAPSQTRRNAPGGAFRDRVFGELGLP